jgi:glucosamine--fructose-6-phosphate aminotransferase (isomerizing)
MCGIIGYNGNKQATPEILNSLQKIEYRGYDSAGIAILQTKGKVATKKSVGGVDELRRPAEQLPLSHMGIGHTRWATHGKPTVANAHPHSSDSFTLVHNGIIENHDELRKQMKHKFKSDTDTEVLAWLLEDEFKQKESVRSALVAALKQVRGAFGLAIMHKDTPNVLYVARRSSPIVIAQLDDGYMVASDVTALPNRTRHVTHLEDDQFAVITPKSVSVYDLNHDIVNHLRETYIPSASDTSKGDQEHFMMKEILEQPTSVANTLRGRLDEKNSSAMLGGLNMTKPQAKRITNLVAIGCGTAHYSSQLASYLLEEICDIPLHVEVASELVYRKNRYLPEQTFAMAVSQSGETADSLAAIKKYQKDGIRTYGIVNVVGSSISRLTDGGTYLHCGPEIAVASTKAFTSQVTAQLLVGLKLNTLRGQPVNNNGATIEALKQLPADINKTIKSTMPKIKQLASEVKGFEKAMYLGRNSLFPVALEGALKYKEITYTPASAHPAGEMKHGPLALVDEDMLVVYLAAKDNLLDKSVSNLEEIDARGGRVLLVTDDEILAMKRKDAILVPRSTFIGTPLIMNVVLQLLAYFIALERGLSIDKPRNLAKSVTVE